MGATLFFSAMPDAMPEDRYAEMPSRELPGKEERTANSNFRSTPEVADSEHIAECQTDEVDRNDVF
ncbi:hypothetical protein DACRYDRAFT_19358 [Dacryopinax primogenitus]|uniref:Uncharacterized protein n=1 Tax=Dacryopinax primogenitus (strain DJM 731) TaxID=1858805 RepID=M5GF77_DACPD|nr:uncharacterized protein DACRYDRAFT_19358 [Dacryopinax primogenitus]EJU06027.1 hypothetical protein DACRYDRAFT_19358 [Dacryopinax primogenitus]